MAAPRKLPDTATLRGLRANGWTHEEIGKKYGVTTSAVWHRLKRARQLESRPSYSDILPWKIEHHHQATAIMRNFRFILREQNGDPLLPHEKSALELWLNTLEQANLVVNYHPTAPPNDASRVGGWFYTPRLPTDRWIIREPDLGD